MIKISKRLEAISSLVPINSSIIDIGCDHALLDIYLIDKNKIKKAIASDINNNALDNAKENIKKYNLDNTIETRLGNGLNTLSSEDMIDTIVISGMGAHTVIGILKNNLDKIKDINTIIIQSNTKLGLLRKEITKLNYIIEDELMVEDNKKIYTIIKFIKGKKNYSKKEIYFGPILLNKKDKLFKEYTQKELQKLKLYLKMLPKNNLIDRCKINKEIRLYKNIV